LAVVVYKCACDLMSLPGWSSICVYE
jgi:hypothetical protein